jgi:hypothetical protein
MAMRANPGKFDNALDEAVWSLSLDGGADEEVGSSSEAPGTWAGLLRDGGGLGKALQEDEAEYPNVTGEDRVFLSVNGAAGVILTENSDGQVKVTYYAHVGDLDKDWEELVDELGDEADDDEADDDEADDDDNDDEDAEGDAEDAEASEEGAGATAIVPYEAPSEAHGGLAVGEPVTVEGTFDEPEAEHLAGARLYVVELGSRGDVGLGEKPGDDVIVWIHHGKLTPNRRHRANARHGFRRYRMGAHGEEPVWASKKSIAEMGREEGRKAHAQGRQPIHYGNTTYDDAAREEYESLGGKLRRNPSVGGFRNGTKLYRVRYIHKISPRATDVKENVPLPASTFSDSKSMGRELRKAGVLTTGTRVRSFRVEGDKVVVFPAPSIWHAVIIEDEHEAEHTPNMQTEPDLERDGTLHQLIEMQAETLEPDGRGHVPREVKNELEVTPELRRVVSRYEHDLYKALEEVVRRYPPEDGADAEALYYDKAPYLVLMTLRGEGVGIWDGDWDSHYDNDKIEKVQALLEEKLGHYAEDSGTGEIEEALDDAVYQAMRNAGYGFDEHTYVPIDEGGVLDYDFRENRRPKGGSGARRMTRNQGAHARWHVFLNGEMLDPVYVDARLSAAEVREHLLAAGYDPRITVDQPPERRTLIPPHYKGRTGYAANEKWTRAYIDDLPDSAFFVVERGGTKDASGRTHPLHLRHLPYKDKAGSINLPHVRAALSRIPVTRITASQKADARAKAQAILKRAKGTR